MRVAPNNVAALVALKIPRRNDDNVTFANPDSPFHFSADSAESFVAVLAFYHDAVEPEEFRDDAQDFSFCRVDHLVECAFAQDLFLAQLVCLVFVVYVDVVVA